jgi:hypothetical protein
MFPPLGIERRLRLTIARLTGRARKCSFIRDKRHIAAAARKVDSSIINQTRFHFEWHEVLLTPASFLMCWGIVFIASRVPRLYGSGQNLKAVQATHKRPTPRVGGIAVFGTFALSVLLAPGEIAEFYSLFVLATSIIFVVGCRSCIVKRNWYVKIVQGSFA